MSLGELQQMSEGIYAYRQPDGSWSLNNTGFLVSRDGVISVDATSTERRTRAYLDARRTAREARAAGLTPLDAACQVDLGSSRTFLMPNGSWVTCTGPTSSWTGPTRRPHRPRPGPGRHGGLQRRPPPHLPRLS